MQAKRWGAAFATGFGHGTGLWPGKVTDSASASLVVAELLARRTSGTLNIVDAIEGKSG